MLLQFTQLYSCENKYTWLYIVSVEYVLVDMYVRITH